MTGQSRQSRSSLYRLAWAFEEVSEVAMVDGITLTYQQRLRAAKALLVWVRIGTWAGLDSQPDRWPAGDPARLIVHNIAEHDTTTGRKDDTTYDSSDDGTGAGVDLAATLYAVIAQLDVERAELPKPRDLDTYDAKLWTELNQPYADVV